MTDATGRSPLHAVLVAKTVEEMGLKIDQVQYVAGRGVLSPLDVQFARTMERLAGGAPEEVVLAAALASRAVQNGHVCLDLARLHEVTLLDGEGEPIEDLVLPPVKDWCQALAESPLVGRGDTATPLVLEEPGRLYLWRYWRYQQRLAHALCTRAAAVETPDRGAVRAALDRLFAPTPDGRPDRQRWAAAVASQRRLTVVSGGPGTGKTSTVVKVLAVLQEDARARGRDPLRIALVAPTGKAAARLGEAIAQQKARLCEPNAQGKPGPPELDADLLDSIPHDGTTIQRLLGYQPRTPTRYRHDADNPLPFDVVLVDEASMVDLALMAKLVDAVPDEARLILLGDRDQLASVEAGAILGDLCGEPDADYSPAFVAATAALSGDALPAATRPQPLVQDSIVQLTRSFRYHAGSAIDSLARAVNAGDAEAALAVLATGDGVELRPMSDAGELAERLGAAVDAGFADWTAGTTQERLQRLDRFRVLCAHRKGALGADMVGVFIERRLHERGLLHVDSEYYDGRPIMITRNDPHLELFNGDVGVVVRQRGEPPQVWFRAGEEPRAVPASLLPPHETVFATTVHKSQGSEFDAVALVLPDRVSPVLTRELIYTGITRAKRSVVVLASEAVLREAIPRRVERASGLRAALAARGGLGSP